MIGDRVVLTKPSKLVNPPWDNENHDLIVYTGDLIVNGTRSYSAVSLLGKGTFGQTFNCIDNENDLNMAIKVAKRPRAYYDSGVIEAGILEELRKVDSKLFVEIYSSFMFKQHYCIVMEVLGPNLYELLKIRKFKGFSHNTTKHILRQLLQGLVELGNLNIAHSDLKPENILISNFSGMNVKIIDFGSSFKYNKTSNFYVQSRYYRAPEVIMQCPYDSAIDVWSFACISYEMLIGKPLFPGKSNEDQLSRIFYLVGKHPESSKLMEKENFVKHETLHKYLSIEDVKEAIFSLSDGQQIANEFYNFLIYSLQVRALERPSPAQILKHAYLLECQATDTKISLTVAGEITEDRMQAHPPPVVDGRRQTQYAFGRGSRAKTDERKRSNYNFKNNKPF